MVVVVVVGMVSNHHTHTQTHTYRYINRKNFNATPHRSLCRLARIAVLPPSLGASISTHICPTQLSSSSLSSSPHPSPMALSPPFLHHALEALCVCLDTHIYTITTVPFIANYASLVRGLWVCWWLWWECFTPPASSAIHHHTHTHTLSLHHCMPFFFLLLLPTHTNN